MTSTPAQVLFDVAELIEKRGHTHGDWRGNMTAAAVLWSTYIGKPIAAHDVAVMLALLKVTRMTAGEHEPDDYDDLVGYAAIAAALRRPHHTVQPPCDVEE
jgi:hypothetical protein